ncbi:response regulator transcription factor [Rhodococcus sp. ACT016]|uniref:response regulator transcription factor n=1 Tax=Rhodococcus sp. ACT016 TaxID=3134808 RepID=UPI003D2C976D
MTPPQVLSAPARTSPVPSLTAREEQVLTTWLVCDSKHDVADRLFITPATVHTHLTRIRDKYHQAQRPANSKIALLVRAIEDGYCTLHDIARATNCCKDDEPSTTSALQKPRMFTH